MHRIFKYFKMERAGAGEDNPAFDDFVNGAGAVVVPTERTLVNRGPKPV